MSFLMWTICKEFLINVKIPQVSILNPTLFLPPFMIKDFPSHATCVILSSTFMIIPPTLSIAKLLICGIRLSWLLNLKLTSNTLQIWVLTLSWRGPLSYRNQSIDLQSKSVDWFLYYNGLRHERVKWIELNWMLYLPLA